jgi:hypothetical protein
MLARLPRHIQYPARDAVPDVVRDIDQLVVVRRRSAWGRIADTVVVLPLGRRLYIVRVDAPPPARPP